jgi:hypothetical protein
MARKFTYWIAECLNDSPCYSLIGKTKREVEEKLEKADRRADYGEPEKREIPYKDMFDFFDWVTSEGSGRACGFQPGTTSRFKD